MSRAQYLKTLEREMTAAAKIIDELTRENYELRQLLNSTMKPRVSQDVQSKDQAPAF